MNIKNYRLCSSLLLSAAISSAASGAQLTTHPGKNGALPSNSNHAQHLTNPTDKGFNPPRQISPKQFQLLQQNQQSADDHYQRHLLKPKKSVNSKVKTISKSATATQSAAVNSCTSPAELQGLSGDELVNAVKSGVLNSCLYGLFNNSLVGTEVFSDASITTIANAINAQLVSYDGTSATGAAELEKLVIYLRAMHWAESSNNRVFPADYSAAVTQALTTYFNGDYFVQFNGDVSRDFMIRYEMLILLNSSGNDRMPFLERITEAILGYANSISRTDDWGVFYEENGMTQLLVHLFNASNYQTDELEQAVINNPNIINNLKQFVEVQGKWLVGHTREYQWSDAVKELARFLRFGGSVADAVRPSIQAILQEYTFTGVGSTGWLNAQSMVKEYDADNCSIYGDACSFNLEDYVLSGNHTCSATIKLRYQEPISEENLGQICTDLTAEEQKFHNLFNTNASTPVADDFNSDLEVVIFSSYSDYDSYAGGFFGIGTDNGGMYLEGDPWVEGNQARFIAHQATWLPEFAVWNLEHEYVHYLDGRFNKWGNFNEQPANTVWWGEGLAEYLSQPDNNPKALGVAPQGTYSLSELFQTTYENSNTERTYYWGYLATRFMIEQQNAEIENSLLPSMRARKKVMSTGECQFDWGWKLKTEAIENGWGWAYDDSEWSTGIWVWTCGQPQSEGDELPVFTPYQDILATWGTSFDQDFEQWLVCLVEGEGICEQQATNPADFDGNGAIDIRDINLFKQLLRNNDNLSLDYDFNHDGTVDRRDTRAMMALCDLTRCAIAP
ncbi:hypothetical protein tinsulaeT_03090 [Thalassotalea insulae]|uniref:microbial collagenase n=1 Tax=Thalassotalea insulae TaxID=2056778 RepID=A0ABQ6GNU8_9GAMM|nr:collagenase [Thalassotalea insulae]GLX76969.1 hypothetical protein tinsulaeT_03090 [Thalassotalea insulae]